MLQLKLLGLEGAKSVSLVTAATRGMSEEDLRAVLVKTELNKAQMEEVLTSQGISKAKAQETAMTIAQERADAAAIVTKKGLNVATGSLRASLKGLFATIKAHPVMFLISAGLTLFSVIKNLISGGRTSEEVLSELRQKFDELSSSVNKAASDFKNLKSEADEVIPKFVKLSEGVDQFGKNISLTDEEYAEFLKLNNQIAEMFPELNVGMDESGNAMLDLSYSSSTLAASLYGLVEAQRELYHQDVASKMSEVWDNLKDQAYVLDEETRPLRDDKELFNDIRKQYYSLDNDYDKDTLVKTHSNLLENMLGTEAWTELLQKYDGNWQDIFESEEVEKALKDIEDKIRDSSKNINSIFSKITPFVSAWLETGSSNYKNLSSNVQSMIKFVIKDLDYSVFDTEEDIQEYIESNIVDPIYNATPAVRDALESLFSSNDSYNNDLISVEEYQKQIDNAISILNKEGFGASLAESIRSAFNVRDLNKEIKTIKSSVIGSVEDTKKYIDSLSSSELKFVYKIVAKNGFITFEELEETINRFRAEEDNFVETLEGIQKFSAGFDLLDKIYTDVSNGENFDWSSILNNDDFVNAFGELGTEYDNFIKTITNNNGNIDACQEAFNGLATAYLLQCERLRDVTDATRDSAVAMLEQMGITNSAKIVDGILAHQKEKLRVETELGTDATYEDIVAKYDDVNASEATKKALAELALEKAAVNSEKIETSGDIQRLIDFANTANATTASLENLRKAKALFLEAERREANVRSAQSSYAQAHQYYSNDDAIAMGSYYIAKEIDALKDQARELVSQKPEYYAFDPSEFITNYVGGSSGGTGSGKGSEKSNDTIDWIETLINRTQRAIEKLKNIATSTYKSLKSRLSATKTEISKVNSELSIQQKAYDRYMKEANSVGLSSALAEKVRNGTININEYDDKTSDLIKTYQQWYEAALECSDAIDELHENLASLYEDNFNNIKDDYDNQLSLLEHMANTYNADIDMLEAKGYLDSVEYYASLQNITRQNVSLMNKELSELEKSFSKAMNSGEIEEYSESWYGMKNEINGVKEEIAEANVELVEFAKKIREINWGYFDYAQERISQITQESKFLIDLMSNSNLFDDNGRFTSNGMATMGLYAQNYNVYMSQAEKYAEEILRLDKEIAEDPYNTELIERREELLELQQDSIRSAEEEKYAIVDMVKNGIDVELSALKELIDSYNESLDSAKSLWDYQEKVADKSAEISSLQKQLAAYSGDSSEETRATVQKLQVDLAKAQEDLAKTEYEQFISDQKKLLDDLYTEYEDLVNERLDNVEVLLSDMIDTVNANSDAISVTLEQVTSDVGYTMTQSMQSIWDGSTNALDGTISMYGDNFTDKLTSVQTVLNSINTYVANMVAASDEIAKETDVKTSSETSAKPSVSTGTASASKAASGATNASPSPSSPKLDNATKKKVAAAIWRGTLGWGSDPERAKKLTEVFGANNGIQALVNQGIGLNDTSKDISEYSYLAMRKKFKGYKSGGIVDYTGLAKVDGTPQKPELMLNANDTKNFLGLTEVLRSISYYGFLNSPKLNGLIENMRTPVGNVSTTFGDFEINIPIEHVEDYNDFIDQLKHDKQFEKMVQSMTLGRMMGKGRLDKYRQ